MSSFLKKSLFFSITLMTSASILLGGCKKKNTEGTALSIPVTAVTIDPHDVPVTFEYVGVAESSHIVEIRARVEGYLEQITYPEGDRVEAGQRMFVLDQRPFQAALDSQKGILSRQQAVLWNAQQTKNRMVPLYQQNAVSLKDLDDAIASELAAEADVLTAQANVEKARLDLSFASIYAPVGGMANQAKYREGSLISPGPNSLLTTIYVLDPIWVNFSVSEGDILRSREELKKGLLRYPPEMNFSIEVVLADGSVLPAVGRVDFTDPALQQNTGTMSVRAVLPNPQLILRPGQFVRVRVKGAVRPQAVVIPQSSVLEGQKGTFVYVIDKEGKASNRWVDAGDWYEDFWIINSGLSKGDQVIVQGVNKVQNGTPVKVTASVKDKPAPTPSAPESGW